MAESHREEIAKLETLYANNPEGRVFTHLAEAYRKAGELERAREILEDGLRRHSDYSSAHVVLGRVLADQGDRDGAAGAFRRVLELDRHNLVALRSLGEISAEAGRTDEALHYYRELLSLDPSDEALRGTVRGLEERRSQQAAAVETPPAEPEPADTAVEAAETPLEPSGEPPAWVAGETVPAEPEIEPQPVASEPDIAAAEPVEFAAGLGAAYAPEHDDEAGVAEPPQEAPAAQVSENWEEDVGIELEPLPGDLAALAGEAPSSAPVEGLEPTAAEEAWAVTSEWLAQPPVDPLASGLDLGIEGEDLGRMELPASDLELTEPAGDDLTPFDMPSGSLDLAPEEPAGSTPFDVLDAADSADVPPDAVFGTIGTGEALDIDVGPPAPEFGGPEAEAEGAAWYETEPAAEGPPWQEAEPTSEGPVWSEAEAAPSEGPAWSEAEATSSEAQPWFEAEAASTEAPAWSEAEATPEEGTAWAEAESAPSDEGEGELVTETMAELYFAQGAYDRAADVYRSLLQSRPEDARLRERLADAEARAGAAQSAEEGADVWLEGVESAWTGGGGVAGAEATPYAWAEPSAEEVPAGPRVGEYFRSLLSWRPGMGTAPAATPVAEEPGAVEPAGAEQLAYEAAETEAPEYLPMDALEEQPEGVEATTAEPWAEPARAPELPEAASVAGAEEDGSDDDEDLEMFRSWLQSLRK